MIGFESPQNLGNANPRYMFSRSLTGRRAKNGHFLSSLAPCPSVPGTVLLCKKTIRFYASVASESSLCLANAGIRRSQCLLQWGASWGWKRGVRPPRCSFSLSLSLFPHISHHYSLEPALTCIFSPESCGSCSREQASPSPAAGQPPALGLGRVRPQSQASSLERLHVPWARLAALQKRE